MMERTKKERNTFYKSRSRAAKKHVDNLDEKGQKHLARKYFREHESECGKTNDSADAENPVEKDEKTCEDDVQKLKAILRTVLAAYLQNTKALEIMADKMLHDTQITPEYLTHMAVSMGLKQWQSTTLSLSLHRQLKDRKLLSFGYQKATELRKSLMSQNPTVDLILGPGVMFDIEEIVSLWLHYPVYVHDMNFSQFVHDDIPACSITLPLRSTLLKSEPKQLKHKLQDPADRTTRRVRSRRSSCCSPRKRRHPGKRCSCRPRNYAAEEPSQKNETYADKMEDVEEPSQNGTASETTTKTNDKTEESSKNSETPESAEAKFVRELTENTKDNKCLILANPCRVTPHQQAAVEITPNQRYVAVKRVLTHKHVRQESSPTN